MSILLLFLILVLLGGGGGAALGLVAAIGLLAPTIIGAVIGLGIGAAISSKNSHP